MKIQMLTQTPCPKCENLKMFLKMGLADKYKDDIEIVHADESPELFEQLKKKHKVQGTPVLVYGEQALYDCTPPKSEAFLRTHLNK